MTTNAQPVQAIARVKSIFEINTDYIELADLLDELGGELTPEIEERLKINREELEAKVKAYVHLIRVRESNITAVDNEIARLSLLKQTPINLDTAFAFLYVKLSGDRFLYSLILSGKFNTAYSPK